MLLNILVCTDPNIMNVFAQNGFVIVFIGDCSNQQLIQSVNGLPGSLFNPPFEAVVANVDGDWQKFNNIYLQYLSTNAEVNDFIMTMIQASVINGKGIILYLEQTEYMMYFNVLQQYTANNYGLTIGDQHTGIQSQINDKALQNIIQTMYIEDRINFETYLKINQLPYSDIIIQKLILDLGLEYIYSMKLSNEQYYQIFNNIRQSIIDNGRYIRQPFIRI